MPWKEIKPMDQRVQLIEDWKSGNYGKTDLSKKYGVSPGDSFTFTTIPGCVE